MEISLWLLLFCWSAVLPKTLSQPLTTYLVTAPTSLRLDAVETVLVQLFGFTQPVELYVILKSTQGSQSVKYSEERLTLNQANNYQAAAKVQVLPKDLVEGASNVVLLVQGSGINDQRVIDISRSNGFMFIQTDKSLYTPEQSVKVRVYSLNEELRPANRKVILTFKDPEGQKVDISELIDNNNGIPSMQNPFKIPLNPKLGVWSIEATYSKDFDTQAIAVFQVKEYVLPSISITVKPEENFISSDNYRRFAFQISASYVNGVPVRKGVVFIRYGFISNKGEPVIFPNSLTRKLLSPLGVVDVNQDIKALLAGTARYTLESLIKKYLYITVLVQEEQGGISEETEYTAVKFVRSPYSLHLITTPRFVKPGLPYNIKVLVRDPTGQPVAGVPVNIVDKCIVRGSPTSCYCTGSEESQSDGFIERICNIPPHTAMAVLTYVTAAPARSAEGQASFILEAPAYNSPQSRYLYIHHPQRGSLVIGHHVHIRVSAATARNVPSFNVNYMVLSKGKVVTFGVVEGSGVSGQNQFVRFRVTPEMTPSIRLLVYYLIEREVVADSLWIEVEGKCVNSLKTEVRYRRRDQRPKSHLLLDVSTKQDGLVALSAVDTAIFPLRRNHKDPVDMVLRHIELSDQGCGAGGGGDAQGVFQLAGLTLLTNAIHQGSQSAGTCTEAVRAKRSLTEKEQKAVMGRKLPGSIREKRSLTEEQKMAMVAGHGNVGRCCRRGLDHIPSRVTCEQFAIQSVGEGYPRCRKAFQDCCERLVKSLPEDLHYSGRGQAEFSHLAAPPQPAPVLRAKRSLTNAQENELVAGHGKVGRCCRRGLDHIPSRVTCEQFAIQSVRERYPRCRKAFQDCCERLLKSLPEDLHYSRPGQANFSHLAARPQPAPAPRAKRSLTEAQENELVAGHGNVGRCCRRGLDHIPNRVTCEQFAIQSVGERYPRCRKAFQDCCERLVKSLPEDRHYSRPAPPQPAPVPRAKRSLTEAQENELVAGHGNVGRCCRRGLDHIPSRVTCEQFAIQSVGEGYPRCRKAFQDCCERLVKSLPEDLHYSGGQANFSHLAARPQPAPVPRAMRSLTEAQENELVAGHGNIGRCCRRGLDHIPRSVTCEQFAIQSVGEGYPSCRKAFQDCCERLVKSLPEDLHYFGLEIGQAEFSHLAAPAQPAPVPRAKRSLTEAQENELVAGHGNVGKCCRRGLGYIPNSVTCEQFAIHSIRQAFPSCRKAFQDCCERSLAHITGDFQYSRPGIRPGLVRAKRSLTEAQKNELVAGHGNVGRCCRRGLGYLPSSVTCEQFAIQSIRKTYPRCRKAFQDCCERSLESLPEYLQYSRDMGSDLDMAPSVRSYFPESWLWEVQPVRDHLLSVNMSLPDSLTTWQITAVGMFQNGICVQDPVQVSVSLPVSVNIPLPYQLVRGEQLDLLGSVYNENIEPIQYCVTLTVGPEFCLLHSQSDGDSGLRTTACVWTHLSGSGVGKGGPFTLLGLKPGEHTLIFTLRTRDRPGAPRDIVKKKLRVVPEGVRKETSSVGTLDPQGIYGSEKIKVLLKNRPPPDLVPDSSVERSLSFNGVIMGKMLSVILEPEGLGKLIRRPLGSAEAGLDGLLPLIHVYRYLEWNDRWNVLGEDVRANIFNLKTRIKEGVVNMLSFRVKDNPSSYSLWMKGKPSTRLTAKVVHTLALLKDVIKVDYTSVGLSVDWLINAQNGDGSFRELALDSKRVTADPEEHSVYLTSFVLISLKRATQIKHSALQQQSQRDAMTQAVLYISQHVMDVKSLYVRAVATYALTYHNIDNEMATTLFENLEGLARQKVGTMELRYWQESNVAEWQQPDQSSGLMVATTAYVMLTSVFKGRLYYVKPIVNWLTQDQHYGGGFYSTEDMVLTLEAITEYSLKLTRSELNQDIVVSGKDIKALVKLRENLPMVPPVQVHTYGDITVSTGYGNGVSHVELKTVYYQTTVSLKECNFDFNIELTKKSTRTRYHSLTACVKYRPPPNEVEPESGLTVLEIHLPTGVQPNLNELEPFKNGDIPAILSYKMRGNVVIIEMEYVPSDIFRCIGFRVRAEFNVVAAAKSIFRVFESEVQGSVCEKQFSFAEEDLQRLCFGKECQCMKAACATYRGNSTALTAEERILETCYDHIQYAYKVKIKSAVAEGDFMTYTAIVVLVLKQKDQAFEGVRPGVEVALVKKATCSWVELHKDAHFIVQGSRGSELLSYDNVRYRFPLDLDAVLELLPDCGPTGCMDSELNQYEEDLQIFGCG
ncbi:complement C5 isoform X16 [Gadus morhua]|uniref:complement C5 isoform X16 n=1 Tax=Gadus morhua TaxID=8049 RepID=UPI0011B40F00|nr:complement C5 isoform X16 [Gadus morhua]